MYTQCPHCQTTFRIAEAHLKAAKGRVRCGSCQEIFDATVHLSSGVPPEPSAPVKPAPTPPPNADDIEEPFRFDDPDEHDHIDLSIPISRESMPDQSPFMESIYDENSPYNNLDMMGEIKIPGELNFGDSFIKFAAGKDKPGQTSATQAEEIAKPARPPNPYEDVEDQESPATTSERAGIDDLYKSADTQMTEDDLLDQNIEELLALTAEFDHKPLHQYDNDLEPDDPESKPEDEDEKIDLDIPVRPAAIQPKLEASKPITAHKTSLPLIDVEDEFDHDFEIDDDDEPELDNKAGAQTDTKPAAAEFSNKPARSAVSNPADELPSAEFEIPKALRSSFEKMDIPIRPIGQTLAMIVLLAVLSAGFLFQLIFFRSYELANQAPALTPILTTICTSLPCRYSGSIDVTQIELLNRDVRSHPTQKNALLISTAFINNAKFTQPYPTIAVKLSDLSGHVVATRHFRPEEYLDRLYSKFLLMEAGTPIHITLAVLDPGDDAINFEFSFLQ